MKTEEGNGAAVSPFAERMLAALRELTAGYAPHACGGFTTDDMQWRMGIAFTPEETLWAALDELIEARLIRHCGDDEQDAIGVCYEISMSDQVVAPPPQDPDSE